MSKTNKLPRAISILTAVGVCAVTFAASNATPTPGASSGVALKVKEARAGKPNNGGGGGGDWKLKFCGLLGIGPLMLEEAPRACGDDSLGKLAPKASVCMDMNKTDLGADGARQCEKCVEVPKDEKCKKHISVKAKIKADISLNIPGVGGVVCKAGSDVASSADAVVEYTNSKWQPRPGPGNDGEVTYYSEIVKSSATSKAQVKVEGGCEILGKGANMEMELECEIGDAATFGNTSKRGAMSCGEKDAAVEDAEVVEEPVDAGAPADSGAGPTDAGVSPLDAHVKEPAIETP